MATWIEFRCEDNAEDYSYINTKEQCWTNQNDGGGEICGDSVTELLATKRRIEKNLKEAGWKRFKIGWVCPHCIKHRNAQEHQD